jgi:hypothetical protein
MTDNVISHPRRAVILKRSSERLIANGAESLRLQEQIFKVLAGFGLSTGRITKPRSKT